MQNLTCVGTIAYHIETRTFFPIGCGRWSCEECAQKNARAWALRARTGVELAITEGRGMEFVTLTQPGSISTPEFAYSIMRNQWDTLRRRFPKDTLFMYLCFVEQHPKRRLIPHIHMLTTVQWSKKVWKDIAPACGWGYQIEVKHVGEGDRRTHIPAAQASWYVSKYVAKGDLSKQGMPKGFRRVRASRNWPYPPDKEIVPADAVIVKGRNESVKAYVDRLYLMGFTDAWEGYAHWRDTQNETLPDQLIMIDDE